MDFAAIDFETANFYPSSICSVGIIIVHKNQIIDSFYSLIFPEPEYYCKKCSEINGLHKEDTSNAPIFPNVWKLATLKIKDLSLFAHNSRFDENCLKAVHKIYQMYYPNYRFYDTLKASRRAFPNQLVDHKLDTVAKACGYSLKNHHNALADAEACAAIAIHLKDFFDL